MSFQELEKKILGDQPLPVDDEGAEVEVDHVVEEHLEVHREGPVVGQVAVERAEKVVRFVLDAVHVLRWLVTPRLRDRTASAGCRSCR